LAEREEEGDAGAKEVARDNDNDGRRNQEEAMYDFAEIMMRPRMHLFGGDPEERPDQAHHASENENENEIEDVSENEEMWALDGAPPGEAEGEMLEGEEYYEEEVDYSEADECQVLLTLLHSYEETKRKVCEIFYHMVSVNRRVNTQLYEHAMHVKRFLAHEDPTFKSV
jgi:hypothetical protein